MPEPERTLEDRTHSILKVIPLQCNSTREFIANKHHSRAIVEILEIMEFCETLIINLRVLRKGGD